MAHPVQPAREPFSPATLGPVTLRNRIIKAATFEGMTPQRLVTDDLIRFHRRVAAGGVGMCTVACNKCMPTIYSGTRCVLVSGGARAQATSSTTPDA